MDGNAKAEPCTRKLAWFHSATSMDGLAQVHGWTFRSAWFRFWRCMDGLKKPDFDLKIMLVIRRKSIPQPPRQEVLPPPLKLRRTSRLLIPRQLQHPQHFGEGVNGSGRVSSGSLENQSAHCVGGDKAARLHVRRPEQILEVLLVTGHSRVKAQAKT